MPKGVNRVTLIGHLGKDPEMRYTSSGVAVCNFSIATNDSYKNTEGERVDTTEWHNIVVWRKLAEICAEYLKKGSKVYLEGKLTHRSYDDKNGVKRYVTEVVMDEMVMLDSRPNGGRSAEPGPSDDSGGKVDDLPF